MRFRLTRRHLLASGAAWPFAAGAQSTWGRIEQAARGQTVYFNAWAGSERVNAYLQWAAGELQRLHGVKLEHVKITDTAEAVRRVRAEKAAARGDGSVDMVWINGENFLAMKREGLLFGPFAEQLPSFAFVDVAGKPTTRIDFSEPVEGFEAPWGMAQFTFIAERSRVATPPDSMTELLAWARANPGRLTYPRPPQFLGTTFVKQALVELPGDRQVFASAMTTAAFEARTPALWAFLDALHPHLWRQGRQFPATPATMRQMLADGELHIAATFNPNEAANLIATKALPASIISYQHSAGTLGNTHFLAIPHNARAKEGAQVAINFLLSPAAQVRKADVAVWGDPTVLAPDKVPHDLKDAFDASRVPGAVLRPAPALPEPHASWVDPLEREWTRRYGVA